MGLESLVGFRFHPTDEELVDHYLRLKILGMDSEVYVIPEVDICKCEPRDLPGFSLIPTNDQKWYFFCPREVKNPNGSNRVLRATKEGYWKPTGNDREVKSRGTNKLIGTKKTLVFHKGRARDSERTSWVIHEYHFAAADDLTSTRPSKKSFVLCLLKNKGASGEVEPSSVTRTHLNDISNNMTLGGAVALNNGSHHTSHMDFDGENLVAEETTLEFDPELEAYLLGCFSDQPPELQSQMLPEQGPSFMDLSYSNGFSNNREGLQVQFGTDEPEDDWRTYIVDAEDEHRPWAESSGLSNLAVKRSEMPERHVVRVSSACSLTREYVKDSESSSETDTEVHQSRYDPIVKTLRSLNRHAGTGRKECLSQGRHFGTLPSSNSQQQYRRENIGFLHDESGGSNASSLDSAADRPFEINCIEFANPEFPINIRTGKHQYQPKSHKFVAQGAAPERIRVHKILPKEAYQGKVRELSCSTEKHEGKPHSVEGRDAAEDGTSTNLPEKENSIVMYDNDLGKAQEVDAKLSLKSRLHGSADNNRKGSIIFLETHLVSHRTSSPAVYAVNVLLGIFLFVVIFLGKCC